MQEESVLNRLIFSLYQGAWRLARPFLRRNKRLRDGWSERLAPETWISPFDGITLWFQAASGGEAYLLAAVARILLKEWDSAVMGGKKLRILGTTCTRQGMDVLERLQNEGPWAESEFLPRFFPLDEPGLMNKAIAQARPAQIVLLETELWPGLLRAAKQAAVPLQVLNGRITSKSLSGYAWLPASFWRSLSPDRILAISKNDAERFARLFGSERTGLMPNIKFDLLRLEEGVSPIPEQIGVLGNSAEAEEARPRLALFASVRRQEAEAVAKAVKLLKAQRPDTAIVLAPRHLHHVPLWKRQLEQMEISSVLRSELSITPEETPDAVLNRFVDTGKALIWDKFGDLKQLYSEAGAVYVGGSLAPLGGQNFLEALGAGLRPCVGPHIDNFLWAGDSILTMVRQLPDADALAAALAEELDSPDSKAAIKEQFAQRVRAQRGGSRQAAEAILKRLAAHGAE
ncbi:MAG: 3-deoxy-D-manno-octulosonic acid transferase [Desulfovibrionaceae bacterium]|nr:3-deoxy-D-manno-octulosonic acid transferase [Desulfovibrionaceae bacterium]